MLRLVEAAIASGIDLVQLRETSLSARVLYRLALSAAELTQSTGTRLLVNDRSDIASAAGADGVHLTTRSLPAKVIRQTFGSDFLIGVSTHTLQEAETARRDGGDFIVFGPVFESLSKTPYGKPLGLPELAHVSSTLSPFPVMALGGITAANAASCIQAGAQGIAAIRMFNDPLELVGVVNEIREKFAEALD